MIRTIVKKNDYMDSVFLMNATKRIMKIDGVLDVVVVMGTEMNKTVLAEFGGLSPEALSASPNDLIVALDIIDEKSANSVIKCALESLEGNQTYNSLDSSVTKAYPSLRQAACAEPKANLALISVPGDFAAQEAKIALAQGMHVFIFSDNVPLSEEVALKQIAQKKGLFVMGPGCGTSVINNISLGVMSKVRRGRIGIVGASGSGIHEIAIQVHKAGMGVSQAIGTGGKDISKEVGGSTMIRGLRYLEQDKDTDIIVMVSKPPHPDTMIKILFEIKKCQKPVVVFLLGGQRDQIIAAGAHCADTLEHAAQIAVTLARGGELCGGDYISECKAALASMALEERKKLKPEQKYLRAVFCGGTHSEEAVLMLQDLVPTLHSNLSFGKVKRLENRHRSVENSLIDMGDEEFTKGRPHPVMDPSIINDRLLQEGSDPEVAVILFDLLFGHGVHKDPVGAIEDSLKKIRNRCREEDRYISMVASLCGTDLDIQGVSEQAKRLEDLGVILQSGNAKAAILAGMILG